MRSRWTRQERVDAWTAEQTSPNSNCPKITKVIVATMTAWS